MIPYTFAPKIVQLGIAFLHPLCFTGSQSQNKNERECRGNGVPTNGAGSAWSPHDPEPADLEIMRRIPLIRWLVPSAFVFIAAAAHAQWVAFNDHSPTTNTHPNATIWNILGVTPPGSIGLLTNIANATATPVTSSFFRSSSTITGGASAARPAAGTPCYNIFNGFVDFQGNMGLEMVQVPTNTWVTNILSGLDPARSYSFRGSAVRGGTATGYTNRWTKATLLGAASYSEAHSAAVVTSAQAPVDLQPGEGAFNSGVNNTATTGAVVGWDDIDPGPDGTIMIVSTRYTGFVPNGSSTLNNPPYGYAINGFRLEEVVPTAISITSGPDPSSTNIFQGGTASFSVTVSGTGARYRWFRTDGQPIQHAVTTSSRILTITNAQPSDSAVYRVEVSNSINSQTSGDAFLNVELDTIPPTLVSALGFLNHTTFLLRFSESLDTATGLSTSDFHIELSSGGAPLTIASLVYTNGTNVFITTSNARDSNVNYSVTINAGAVSDANGVPFEGGTFPLWAEVGLLAFTNTAWRYNHEGIDLGNDWFAELEYDDSSWSNGISVFDGTRPQPPGRATVAGFPVRTQLPLTNSVYPQTNAVIPTYYYRTRFNLPTTPDQVMALKLRTVVDDFDELFLNHQEAYRNASIPAANPPSRFGYAGGTAINASILGPFDIDPNLLAAGDNLACAIVNQVNATSSDSTFAYELIATVARFAEARPYLTVASNGNGTITITSSAPGTLYEADRVDAPPSEWQVVQGQSNGSATVGTGASQKFYTLRQ